MNQPNPLPDMTYATIQTTTMTANDTYPILHPRLAALSRRQPGR